jgi:hemoglobin-like flavoprotein
VGSSFAYAFKKGIGNDFTSEVRKAWIEVYKIIAEVTDSHAYSRFDVSTYKNKKIYQH